MISLTLARYRSSVPLNTRFDRVIIHGRVYDVTEFKEEHPGGKFSRSNMSRSDLCITDQLDAVILKWAGKDATETYDPIHPPDTLDKSVSPRISPGLSNFKS